LKRLFKLIGINILVNVRLVVGNDLGNAELNVWDIILASLDQDWNNLSSNDFF